MTQNCPFEPESSELDASNAVPPPKLHAVDLLMESLAYGGLTAFDDEETIARKAGGGAAWSVPVQSHTAWFVALTIMAFAVGAAQTIWVVRSALAETTVSADAQARVVKKVVSVPIGGALRPSAEPLALPVVAVLPAPQLEPVSARSVESAPVDPPVPSKQSARQSDTVVDPRKAADAPKQTPVELARSAPPVDRAIARATATPQALAAPMPSNHPVAGPPPAPGSSVAEPPTVESIASESLNLPGVGTPSVPENAAAMQMPPAATPTDDSREIEIALERYKQAYSALDVAATARVWPTVERRSLERAFATLKSQSVAFASCDVRVQGFSAVARCNGTVQFVRAVGNGEPRVERQQWTFQLRKLGGQWRIDDVVAVPQGRAARAVVDLAPAGEAKRQNAALAPSAPASPRH